MRVIYVVDVGSPKAGLAWARLEDLASANPTGGSDLGAVVRRIAADLRAGHAVSLGLEAPGFVPVPVAWQSLGKARKGESRDGHSRPWSVRAGVYCTANAIPILAWLLRELSVELAETPLPTLTMNPDVWLNGQARLLLWEAFVSGPGHARTPNDGGVSVHIQDAATAAVAFHQWCALTPRPPSAIQVDTCLSTFGAAAIWAGWTIDLQGLHEAVFVLWPQEVLGVGVVLDVVTVDLPSASANASDETVVTEAPSDETVVTEAPLILTLTCADTHSIWRKHQGDPNGDFETLVRLLNPAGTTRSYWVSFNLEPWQRLDLRVVGQNQVSWRGHNAAGSLASPVAARVEVLSGDTYPDTSYDSGGSHDDH